MKVEGIQIFNWGNDYAVESTQGLPSRASGVYSFMVEYGTSLSAMFSLHQVNVYLRGVDTISSVVTLSKVFYLLSEKGSIQKKNNLHPHDPTLRSK